MKTFEGLKFGTEKWQLRGAYELAVFRNGHLTITNDVPDYLSEEDVTE